MIRYTLILIAGIGVTLSVAGRDLDTAATGLGSEVTRQQTDLTDATPERLALDDEQGAIARAVAATENYAPVTAAQASTNDATSENDEAALVAYVNADRVNLRAGPSTGNGVVDQVGRDQSVEVLDTEGDWMQIRVSSTGTEAWIFGRFLTPQG